MKSYSLSLHLASPSPRSVLGMNSGSWRCLSLIPFYFQVAFWFNHLPLDGRLCCFQFGAIRSCHEHSHTNLFPGRMFSSLFGKYLQYYKKPCLVTLNSLLFCVHTVCTFFYAFISSQECSHSQAWRIYRSDSAPFRVCEKLAHGILGVCAFFKICHCELLIIRTLSVGLLWGFDW